MIRVRFPPSPTGFMHIGNVRTALFNYLFARKNNGKFILRIEDTDRERSKKEYEDDIIEGLKWLNINWDEGPDIGGPYGPYRQSERIEIYKFYINKLLEEGKAYLCFCSEDELEKDREEMLKKGLMPKYSRKCRNLSKEQIEEKLKKNPNPVVRFKTPLSGEVIVEDELRGKLIFPIENLDDFVIMRSDGMPTYNFAVVIDDALMKINFVIRGEDHLHGNTPRQILIYKALDFPLPKFIHLPMILGEDHTKLSKRHGSVSLRDYRNEGYLPEALVNYMALLGFSPKTKEKEIFSLQELIEEFSIENLSKSNAIFSPSKLRWMNHKYIEMLSLEELFKKVKEFYLNRNFEIKDDEWLMEFLRLMRDHIFVLSDIKNLINDIYKPEELSEEKLSYLKENKNLIYEFYNSIKNLHNWNENNILNLIKDIGKKLSLKGKSLYHPLRVLITHKDEGPEIYIYIYLLGKEETLNRIKEVINKI
ncbi:MAG: glutamate--tRNA ligase [Caldisericia bacterium]|jgi:glutamyl-tRNA synthetase|nr:glutamate--tRNA ligase [Caldisericia bacterium]